MCLWAYRRILSADRLKNFAKIVGISDISKFYAPQTQ